GSRSAGARVWCVWCGWYWVARGRLSLSATSRERRLSRRARIERRDDEAPVGFVFVDHDDVAAQRDVLAVRAADEAHDGPRLVAHAHLAELRAHARRDDDAREPHELGARRGLLLLAGEEARERRTQEARGDRARENRDRQRPGERVRRNGARPRERDRVQRDSR